MKALLQTDSADLPAPRIIDAGAVDPAAMPDASNAPDLSDDDADFDSLLESFFEGVGAGPSADVPSAAAALFPDARAEGSGPFAIGDMQANRSLLVADEDSRAMLRATDQARMDAGQPSVREREAVAAQARAYLDANGLDAVEHRLMQRADDPSTYGGFTDADVALAQLILPRLMDAAVKPGAPASALERAARISNAIREGRADTARSLAFGVDPAATPGERARAALVEVVLTPPASVRREHDAAPPHSAKVRRIKQLQADIAALEIRLLTQAVDLVTAREALARANQSLVTARRKADALRKMAERQDALRAEREAARAALQTAQAEILSLQQRVAAAEESVAKSKQPQTVVDKAEADALRAQLDTARTLLDEAKAQKSKAEILAADRAGRIEDIRKAFAKRGVALEDVFSGEVKPILDKHAIAARLTAELAATPAERKAVNMYREGHAVNAIAKKTGVSADRIEAIMKDFERRFLERFLPAFEAGLTEFDLRSKPLADGPEGFDTAGRPGVDKADARRRALAALAAMGVRRDAATGGVNRDAPRKPNLGNPRQAALLAREAVAVSARTSDALYEFWINSILSGPLTQTANLAGNTLNAALNLTFYRASEAALNLALSAIGRRVRDGARFGEFAWMMRGFWPNLTRAFNNAILGWQTETSVYRHNLLGEDLELAGRPDDKTGGFQKAIAGDKGWWIRRPTGFLSAVDDFSTSLFALIEVNAQAYRLAKQQGLSGKALAQFIDGQISDPQSPSMIAAVRAAEEATFKTELRSWKEGGGVMESAASAVGAARREFTPLRWVVPFLTVVYNIFAQGMRKSPMGSVSLAYQLAHRAYRGHGLEYDKARAAGRLTDDQLLQRSGEQVLAWFAAALCAAVVPGDDDDEDKYVLITGSTPWDSATATGRDAQAQAERAGQPPYTIRVGSTMLDYRRLEPIATALGLGVDALRSYKRLRAGDDSTKVISALLGHIGTQITDKTFAAGIGDMVAAFQDPKNAVDWAANFMASFVPNIIRQPLRMVDPMVREKTVVESDAKSLPVRLATRVMSQALPIPGYAFTPRLALIPVQAVKRETRIDVWGRPMEKGGNAALRLVAPAKIGEYAGIANADRALAIWNRRNPESPTFLGTPSKYMTVEGTKFFLNDRQYAQYAEMAGKLSAVRLAGLTETEARNPNKETIDTIHKEVAAARREAREALFGF